MPAKLRSEEIALFRMVGGDTMLAMLSRDFGSEILPTTSETLFSMVGHAGGELHRGLDLEHRVVEQDRSEIALSRARQLEALRRGRRIERLASRAADRNRSRLAAMSRGSCADLARRRRLDLPRHRRHVVDHAGERRTGAAVDAGVVHLGIEPDLVVLHAFEDIELPERTGAVESLACIQPTMRSSVARSCGAGRLPRKIWRSMSNWSSSTQDG